ncbi:AraC family transcriptional regulator [Bosea sp. LjRoot9]|uniref:AraC family ligand binding domain-containing protein n=1 Tax=Bosea sp. LjRoot9 TaxID=3342341 RepID=UPI003ECF3E0D
MLVKNKVPRGRPPNDQATLKRVEVMGGFEYLLAAYRKQYFARHAHNEYLIGLIKSGTHDVWCRGELWHADAGAIATFAPGEPHFGGAGVDDGWSQRIVYLPEQIVQNVMRDVPGTPRGTLSFRSPFQHDAGAEQNLRRLFDLFDGDASALEVEEALYGLLPRLFMGSTGTDRAAKVAPAALERVRDYLHAHFDQAVQLSDLAGIAGLSKGVLIAGFKAYFGVPPQRYLIQVRLDEARALLRQGVAIAEAAYAVGFADQAHLTRHFRAVLGVTPARYVVAEQNPVQ